MKNTRKEEGRRGSHETGLRNDLKAWANTSVLGDLLASTSLSTLSTAPQRIR